MLDSSTDRHQRYEFLTCDSPGRLDAYCPFVAGLTCRQYHATMGDDQCAEPVERVEGI